MKRLFALTLFLASNLAVLSCQAVSSEDIPRIPPKEVLELLDSGDGPLLLDVRSEREFDSGHVPGAVNIPHQQVPGRLDYLRKYSERGIIVYCESGGRSRRVLRTLSDSGFENLDQLDGDMAAWRRAGLPMER